MLNHIELLREQINKLQGIMLHLEGLENEPDIERVSENQNRYDTSIWLSVREHVIDGEIGKTIEPIILFESLTKEELDFLVLSLVMRWAGWPNKEV